MAERIFFQSSMPRALSTMLQNLIGQNPDFYATPTSGALELVFSSRAAFTNSPEFKAQDAQLMDKAFAGFCRAGLEGYFNSITDKKYVLDKSRGWGVYRSFLDAFYPDPKIICMVRSLPDIVANYEKLYRKGPLKHDPIRDDSSGRGTTVHKRVNEWMSPSSTIGRALERIFEIIRLGYDDKILFVKAEDLCLYPDAEMIRIYQYLDVPYFKHDFDNIEQITREDDSVYGLTPDLHTIRKKLEMRPSDAKSILGKDICDFLYTNFRWYYDKFNYQK